MTDAFQADDDILPVHRGALREWFMEFQMEMHGHPPTHGDWLLFMRGVEARSLVKIRALEQEEFLLDEALRQAAADTGMIVVTIDPDERKH